MYFTELYLEVLLELFVLEKTQNNFNGGLKRNDEYVYNIMQHIVI